jgi:hypothetical protein
MKENEHLYTDECCKVYTNSDKVRDSDITIDPRRR